MMLATALLAASVAVQAPPGQAFYFSARFDMRENIVRLSASRVLRSTPRNRFNAPPTTYPPYRWSVPGNQSAVRFVPLSGQSSGPKVTGLAAAWPPPTSQGMEINGTAAEECGVDARVDWTGCAPGFYRLEASANIHGQNRTWTMGYSYQLFYWRPMPVLKPILGLNQRYLVIGGRMSSMAQNIARRLRKDLGKTLTLVKYSNGRYNISAVLRSGSEEIPLTFMSSEYPPQGVEPVIRDAEAAELQRAFAGKRMYPMGLYLDVITEDGEDRLWRLNRGTASVRIVDVWRAARPRGMGDIDPTIYGDSEMSLSGWFPLYVVLQADPKQAFAEQRERPDASTFIAAIPDAWAFERTFSRTPKMAEFPKWKPQPGLPQPVFPEEGMTPRQLAWVYAWPRYIGSAAQTLRLPEWRFEPFHNPGRTFRFQNGRLLPGPGVTQRSL
ncbi:MAG TPA: hypothetical protein VHE55_11000 [Fimbriimonadaceae bacterium]|nr:hypothetical protein [Fimbriimonadaceae bacterium]